MSSSKKTLFKQLYNQLAVIANFAVAPTDCSSIDNLSYEIIFANATNIPSGSFTLQGADAGTILPNQTMQGATWTNLAMSAVPQIDAASGSHLISINQIPFRFIRLTYTASGGGAQADIIINVSGREL